MVIEVAVADEATLWTLRWRLESGSVESSLLDEETVMVTEALKESEMFPAASRAKA